MNYLPSKLLKLRKHYNYSQAHIADVLGIDVVEYMAFENGRKVLNFNQCKKIANLYHIGVVDVFKNSDEVTLYEVSKAKTDELNIEYFLPEKTFGEKLSSFVKKHSVLLGVTLGVVILGFIAILLFGNNDVETQYVPVLSDANRLSVSETTVVYISNSGAVKGSGDNSNGQLSNLPSSDVIKVAEGSSFTVVLNSNGTVSGIGLISKYAKDLEKWNNIVDVSAGDNHVVGLDIRGNVFAVGDNTFGQCDVNDFKDVKGVHATHNGTIVFGNDGKLRYVGEFVGSSQLKNYTNVIDVDSSNDNLVLLTNDNRVEYITKSKNFLNIYKWRDVVDVACGDEFVAALDKSGNVYIDTEDASMLNDVSKWSNIIAIDSADEYLIAFDGETIFGTGKNNYHQFEQEIVEKTTLPQVSGVKISIDSTIDVSFDRVINADGYEVKLDIDGPIIYKVSSNQVVSFSSDSLEDSSTYRITIKTLGDGINYLDSNPLEVYFDYHKENKNENEYIDIDVAFDGMSVTEFVDYIKAIGVPDTNIIGVETGNMCEGSAETIVSVDGLSSGQRISRSDLNNAKVTYNYCRINTEASEETSDE